LLDCGRQSCDVGLEGCLIDWLQAAVAQCHSAAMLVISVRGTHQQTPVFLELLAACLQADKL
jgi:hypothetical protein